MREDPAMKHSATAPVQYSHSEILQVMTGLLAALFTAMISTTIVSTALPTIMADLDGTQRQYTWVITASLLAMTVTTPIWGKLSDLFDKKRLTQIAIALFVIGSIVAGMSTSIPMMMTARAVQGIAMGGLMSLVQSIMGTMIAPRERGRYAGYMGAVMAVATISGPLLGGLITDAFGWRWCFYVSVPLAAAAFILIQIKLRLPKLAQRRGRIDYLGGVLIAVSAALPMLWVTFAGSDYDWISWESAAFLVAFLIAAALTVIVELRAAEPMIPLRVLRNSTAVLMIIASLGAGVAMFGSGVFLTQYFQLGLGESPTKAGLMTIPMIIGQMLSATIGGQIVTRTGRWKPVMIVGSLMMLSGLVGLATIDHTTSYLFVAVFMALMGLGIGTLVQNVVLAVQNTVDVTEVGAASAAVAFFRSLGGAIGVSALGGVLTAQVAENLREGMARLGAGASALSGGGGETQLDIGGLPGPVQEVFHAAYADAFGLIFTVAAIVAATSVIAIFLTRSTPLRTTIGKQPKTAEASAGKEGS
ncbi:drug resistance transporter, EmrB/QacA subfamily [Brevibacterium aurantiacum]|uniref:Drug resistance transporter, EmrB/QacA subfamily n=2 Tax=Brevibacterium aurantiacum TaxID=273384 RepID=A0A2H1KXV2_BREAU|nr:drug resistance transporter, EmrB/QacA subfamily [Brevibacterium aurantiacum]